MKKNLLFVICLFLLASCVPVRVEITYPSTPIAGDSPAAASVKRADTSSGTAKTSKEKSSADESTISASGSGTAAATPTAVPAAGGNAVAAVVSGAVAGKVPAFDHIALILFENHGFSDVIGNSQMPNLNSLAKQNALLGQYFAVRHPSLPNYIALVSGDTYGIKKDCIDCYLNQPNLADRIEAGGKTWRDYQQDMPSPCFSGNAEPYFQKHNPFLYFDSIRLDSARCDQHVVPLTQLDADLAANKMPNFAFIMPNICNSSHDCGLDVADQWLGGVVGKLQSSPAFGKNSLIIIVFDEAEGQNTSCCGLPKSGGGQVAAVLVSPLVKPGFEDMTPYSHYSLLKTILMAWGLPDLGNTALPTTQPILAAWK